MAHVEGTRGQHVAGEVVAVELQPAPVAPLVRITDLGREGGPLFQRLLLGFIAHPFQPLDAQLQRLREILHQRFHLGLGFRREGGIDVDLAEGLADRAVERVQHALPARGLLGLTAQGLAVEREALLREGFGQVRRGIVDLMEAQVGAPFSDRDSSSMVFTSRIRHRQREHLGRATPTASKKAVQLRFGVSASASASVVGT